MNEEVQELHDRAASMVRAALAASGTTWVRAWYLVKCCGSAPELSLVYAAHEGGPVQSAEGAPLDASDALLSARPRALGPDGLCWNQVLLTLHADGRREIAFDYPVAPPNSQQAYDEAELLARIIDCVRHDLVFEPWSESWAEFGPTLFPYITYRHSADGHLEKGISDWNEIELWLARLWDQRLKSGAGPWAKAVVHLHRDDPRVEWEFTPAAPGTAAPVPVPPPPVPALGELIDRIGAAERADLDEYTRLLEQAGGVSGGWKRVRLTASRDEATNVVHVEHLIEFGDGRRFDDPVDPEVEGLVVDLYERLLGGAEPVGLMVPGLQIESGPEPQFTLVLENATVR
jgi:hypothetical protein